MEQDKLPQLIENDDSARARAFWNANGTSIIVGIIVVLGGIAGFNYWKSYQQDEGENASFLFARLGSGQADIDTDLLVDELQEKYTSTAYAELATFAKAKQLVEKNNLESAAQELTWVINNSTNFGFQQIARLRLASVLLAQNNPEQALEMLKLADNSSFESHYYELIGDAYAQRNQEGDREQAKNEYRKSLETMSPGTANAKWVQLKLDNIGNTQ